MKTFEKSIDIIKMNYVLKNRILLDSFKEKE